MSFILDALKKIEQKRQQSVVPDLLTFHVPDPVKPRKHPIWLYLLLSALFLNALVLTLWLRPWNSEKQGVDKEPVVVKQSNEGSGIHTQVSKHFIKPEVPDLKLPKQEAVVQQLSHVSVKPKSRPVSEPARDVSWEKPAINTVKKNERSLVKEAPDSGLKSSPETPPVQEKQKDVIYNSEAGSGESLPVLNELPLSIRQEMPEISISVHIYSDSPSERLVNINGSIRREGDMLTSDLKLIEITDSGVVLGYKDLRFYVRGFN